MPNHEKPNPRSALDARTALWLHFEARWPGASESGRSEATIVTTIAHIVEELRQTLATTGVSIRQVGGDSIEVSDSSVRPGRRISIFVRGEADFDVGFHVPERRGSPFEQIVAGAPEEATAVQSAVVQFVADLIAERVVLAMDERLLKGGRRFIAARDVSTSIMKPMAWIVSWRGTYDTEASAA